MKLTKAQRRGLERLVDVGHTLSNVAYNLAQCDNLDEPTRKSLQRLVREWDATKGAGRAALGKREGGG